MNLRLNCLFHNTTYYSYPIYCNIYYDLSMIIIYQARA